MRKKAVLYQVAKQLHGNTDVDSVLGEIMNSIEEDLSIGGNRTVSHPRSLQSAADGQTSPDPAWGGEQSYARLYGEQSGLHL